MKRVVCYVVGIATLILLIGAIVLIAISLETLESYEVGLKYDTVSMKLGKDPIYEGLHTGPPGFKFIKFPNVFKTLNFDDLWCLNQDGVKTFLDISYQYRLKSANLADVVQQFRNYEGFRRMLYSLGRNAIMNSCSQFNTSQFQSSRLLFQQDLLTRITEKSNTVHCEITDLQVNDIRRPSAYEEAIRSKETARENIQVANNERPQKLTAAITLKREAETRYTISINRAQTDARIIENQADTKAQAILTDYSKEADSYSRLMQTLGLDVESFLSYLGVRTLENAPNQVYIGLDAPAKSSWMTQK